MKTITPQDAFALALLAQEPKKDRKLLEVLSKTARPIGEGLVNNDVSSQDDEVNSAVRELQEWARRP